jgi:hypothetical protein
MNARNVFDIVLGILALGYGLLTKKFETLGFITGHIFKYREPPRWLFATFYCGIGCLMIYFGITGWHS